MNIAQHADVSFRYPTWLAACPGPVVTELRARFGRAADLGDDITFHAVPVRSAPQDTTRPLAVLCDLRVAGWYAAVLTLTRRAPGRYGVVPQRFPRNLIGNGPLRLANRPLTLQQLSARLLDELPVRQMRDGRAEAFRASLELMHPDPERLRAELTMLALAQPRVAALISAVAPVGQHTQGKQQ